MVCPHLGGALCRAHGQYPGFAPDNAPSKESLLQRHMEWMLKAQAWELDRHDFETQSAT